jgi:acyl-CoA oxidase
MPGVKTGDIGPKLGYHSKDNGWAEFNQVRIPRTDMLMGLCNVDRQGKFTITGDLRALYIVMMMIRTQIVSKASWTLAMALLIAVRYAVVRRQFKTVHGVKEERQLLNYQTHIHKFAPLIG